MSLQEVNSLLERIIDKAKDKNIFKLKFKSLADFLQKSYENLNKKFESKPNIDLSTIIQILEKLDMQINIINDPGLFSYFLEKKLTIDELVSDIDLSIDNLNAELSAIGVEKRGKFLTDDSYQDYIEVYDLLDQSTNILNQRKKEVKERLSRCSNNVKYEPPKKILEQYSNNELSNIEDYPIGDLIRDTKFYALHTKRGDRQTFLLEIKDNKKYLQRALDIYSRLSTNESAETFKGFFIYNDDDSNDDDSDPKVFIVTERKGKSLHELLKNKNKFKPGDKTIILYKIAQAMSEIHLKSIFHRSLSTNNVNAIITKDEEAEIMILNFIYSRVMENEINPAYTNSLTLDPARFAAPEFEGSSQYDQKIDVFSFAAIAYELATGKVPYERCDDATVKKLLAKGERPSLEGINDDLAALIDKCWTQEPSDRYSFSQVMSEMVGKRIMVEKNREDKENVDAFYDQFPNNYSIMNISRKFDGIKDEMKKSVQFKHILYSTRNILTECRNYLDTKYKSDDQIEKSFDNLDQENKPNDQKSTEEIEKSIDNLDQENKSKELDPKEKIKQLDDYLDKFSSTITKTSSAFWSDLDLSFESITDEIVQNINNIIKTMDSLGFKLDVYAISIDDLISDARELYFAYQEKAQEDNKDDKNSEWSQKSKDLKSYIRKNHKSCYRETFTSDYSKLIVEIDKQLTNFSKCELQYNKNDFEEYKAKLDEDNLDDLDAVTDHKLYKGKSTIHKAIYRKLNELKSVAIKKFHYRDLMSHNAKSDLRNEIEFLSNVHHEYIAKFIGYMKVESAQEFWIITELANNEIMPPTLKKVIPTLKSEEKTQLAIKLATVMKYLHSVNISHRGLTSENILISGNCPKLIDFVNASPDIRGVNHGQTLTDTEYDTKNDIFAFAMILYEMLTGKVLKGPEYEIDESVKESGIKSLIQEILGSVKKNELNFEEIYNMMTNGDTSFPE